MPGNSGRLAISLLHELLGAVEAEVSNETFRKVQAVPIVMRSSIDLPRTPILIQVVENRHEKVFVNRDLDVDARSAARTLHRSLRETTLRSHMLQDL